jgi:hypothetical protein
LAWLYVRGHFPEGELDHKNGMGTDCRITNLREASSSQNKANARVRANHYSLKGAYWDKRRKKWRSALDHNKKQIWLGYFATAQAAHAAYCKAAKKLHKEFFHRG